MSKSKKYTDRFVDRDYMDGNYEVKKTVSNDRRKDKRIDRALRTKNVEVLVEMQDEGLDPIDYEYNEEYEIAELMRMRGR